LLTCPGFEAAERYREKAQALAQWHRTRALRASATIATPAQARVALTSADAQTRALK